MFKDQSEPGYEFSNGQNTETLIVALIVL